MAVSSQLLEDIESYLDFTWEDEAKEKRIIGYIESSMEYLNEVAGAELNFETDQLARDLLFNRVLYMDSKALDDFGKNYFGLVKELQIKHLPSTDAD